MKYATVEADQVKNAIAVVPIDVSKVGSVLLDLPTIREEDLYGAEGVSRPAQISMKGST